jgi:aminocarboxymuconate-semialdehyde decarboxylase
MKARRRTANTRSAKAKAARGKTASKRRPSNRPHSKPFVIDFHAHIIVPEVLEATYQQSLFAQTIAGKGALGKPEAMPEAWVRSMTDVAARFKDMDAMGVDMQVISPSILQQCTYAMEPEEALRLERKANDTVAETVSRNPDRLVGLGSIPMQDASLACQELDRCMGELKLKGVIISSHVNGLELGEQQFRPFFKRAEQLGATIFIHPAGNPEPRLRKHRLLITLGQPLEDAFAQSSLVYEGVMDAFPKIKIAMAHGGGFLPFYTGRHDNDYRLGRGGKSLKGDFSSYLRRFYYDTVLFNPDMLEFLVTKVPIDRIMLASDYPFAERRPIEYVRRARAISRTDQDAILGANCARLLGLAV